MAEQVQSIGRVVHIVYGDQHYAAIITAVNSRLRGEDGTDQEGQTLTVLPPMDPPFTTVAAFDVAGVPATWHWPEYVPAKGS